MEVIGVRFKNVGRIYYFDPNGKKIDAGTPVIVETVRGIEYGKVAMANKNVAEVVEPVKKIIRTATEADTKQLEQNRQKEKDAAVICMEQIKAHGLDMHLVDVELTFDANKIIFYFTADGRVDFRELVKTLASVFRMRIELRQIGVRDEAKKLNGMGICGRTLCCATFLNEFQPVSIKMAKDQGLSLNPTKISGSCGRLMCCLKYEDEVYQELHKGLPHVGDRVRTPDGDGDVLGVNVLRQLIKVAVKGGKKADDTTISEYPAEVITQQKPHKAAKSGKPHSKDDCGNCGGCGKDAPRKGGVKK